MWSDKGRSDGIYDYTGKSCSTSSYPSNTTSKGGKGSISGGGGVGSQSGVIEQEKAVSKIHPSDSLQEKALAVNVFQKINPYLTQLKLGEWHLGVHTASFEGRKSKDTTYGLSNQIITCLQHLKTHGGADTLKVLTFMQCDLTPDDMIYFGNTILIYPLSLNYLDFSDNRIESIGAIYLFNSFVTA